MHCCINRLVLASAYSREPYGSLPSALKGLTAEFGMGSGVTPSLETPGQNDRHVGILGTKTESRMDIFRPPVTHKQYRNRCENVRSPVRIARLNALLHVHLRPINPVVFRGANGETQS